MPPKPAKSKAAVKAEITDKVREMRIRQQKWMEERESTIKHGTAKDNMKAENQSAKKDVRGVRPSPSPNVTNSAASPASGSQITSGNPTPTNNGFYSWRSNRNTAEPLLDQVELRYSEQSLQSDHTHTEYESDDFASVDLPMFGENNNSPSDMPTPKAYDNVQNGICSETALPQHYEVLADDIVQRVRQEMSLADREKTPQTKSNATPAPSNGDQSLSNDVRDQSLSVISGHCCPVCSKLMLGPSHSPLLIIPCGHTSCAQCLNNGSGRSSSGTTCPVCTQVIQSATPNLMLQQIISGYHGVEPVTFDKGGGSHDQGRSHDPPVSRDGDVVVKSRRGQTELSKNHLGKTYTQPIPKGEPRKTAAECEEAYRNLLLRCDVLHEEEASICDKMTHLDNQKQAEADQITNITEAQDRIRAEIEGLQTKITDLDRHKEGYREKIEELESQRNKERRKLEMVRSTVTQLKDDISKIKKELLESNW